MAARKSVCTSKLGNLLIQNDINSKALAEMLKVKPQRISDLKLGKSMPTDEELTSICKIFELTEREGKRIFRKIRTQAPVKKAKTKRPANSNKPSGRAKNNINPGIAGLRQALKYYKSKDLVAILMILDDLTGSTE